MHLVHPSLAVTLLDGRRIDFGDNAYHAGYISGLGLCSRHSAQSGRHKQHTACVARRATLTSRIEHRNCGTVDYALRTYIHVRSGCHLAVLRHAHGVEALPVIRLGVIGYDHTIGDHNTWRVLVRRKQPQRMSRVHYQGLTLGHLRQVLHRQAVLRPVLEHGTVAAISDKFVRMLGHARVQIVLYHQHYGRSLPTLGRVLLDGAGVHRIMRAQPIHVYAAIAAQLLGKFRSQDGVLFLREIAQRIFQSQGLLCGREDILAPRSVVDRSVIFLRFGQSGRNTAHDVLLELVEGHSLSSISDIRVCSRLSASAAKA